uniref:Uncharacterized protein n=1 Tax=Solanum tuberosum TaxID=4113 RepID=M1E016_SOLTU
MLCMRGLTLTIVQTTELLLPLANNKVLSSNMYNNMSNQRKENKIPAKIAKTKTKGRKELQAQYMNIPINVPPDKRTKKCQTNKGPEIDEYVVDNSEDEMDGDNHSVKDLDEEDETSELLIRAFSPYPDKGLEKEIQKVANMQGLSPRGLHHDRDELTIP